MFRKRDDEPPEADEQVRDEHAYEGNWYRSLKALADQHAQEELVEVDGATAEELDEAAEGSEEIVLQEPTTEEPLEEDVPVVSEYDEPGYQEPAAYEEPAQEEPTFEQPAAVVSEYDEPGYQEPAAYEEPAQEEALPVVSEYDEPGYEEPAAYEEPADGQPAPDAPAIPTPVSDELHTRAGALLERLRRLQHLGDEQEDSEARSSA